MDILSHSQCSGADGFGGKHMFTPERYWQHAEVIVLFCECCKLL